MNEARHSTAIHEAGHVVVSYALGRRIMHVTLLDDRCGEVMPQCSVCEACIQYYEKNSPTEGSNSHSNAGDINAGETESLLYSLKLRLTTHSQRIQDNLRRDAAVAMAGEIAERTICGDHYFDQDEVAQDRLLSRSRASAIHLWFDTDCYLKSKWANSLPCTICDDYLEALGQIVEQIVRKPIIRNSIEVIAELLEQHENGQRIHEPEINKILSAERLWGTEFNILPSAPRLPK